MTEIAVLRASVNAMRALVGAVFAYTVFDNFSHHNYSASGYRHLIAGYLRHNNSQFFHPFMQFASYHSTVFAPLQAVTETSIAIALLVGLVVPLAALLAGALLTGLFLAETGLYWTWELPPLIFISAVTVMAAIPTARERGLRTALLGRPNAAFLPLAVASAWPSPAAQCSS